MRQSDIKSESIFTNNKWSKWIERMSTPKVMFLVGLILVLIFAANEVYLLKARNYLIFREGSLDLWRGLDPYNTPHLSKRGEPLDEYLYGPLFSLLFTPFALLPWWLGALLWDLFNFSLFFYATINKRTDGTPRLRVILFYLTLLMVINSCKSFQFNLTVLAMFFLIYRFLEDRRYTLAVILMVIGALTKVYVGFAVLLLPFYPQFWKNVGRGLLITTIALLLPSIAVGVNGLLPIYQSWIYKFAFRSGHRLFYVLYKMLEDWGMDKAYDYSPIILFAGMILPMLYYLYMCRQYKVNCSGVRAMLTGSIMAGLMVLGNSTELHTVIIGIYGMSLWAYALPVIIKSDQILWWIYYVLYGIIPFDFLFPPKWSRYIHWDLNLGIMMNTIVWLRMAFPTPKRLKAVYLYSVKG